MRERNYFARQHSATKTSSLPTLELRVPFQPSKLKEEEGKREKKGKERTGEKMNPKEEQTKVDEWLSRKDDCLSVCLYYQVLASSWETQLVE